MKPQLLRINLARETPFAFSCRRCLSCCHNKKIQVNPYEIARLARNRGLSTAQFIENDTVEEGTFLKWDKEGACIFLDFQGCTVHEDRPLVCRLYPLGRHVLNTLEESYSEMAPDPDCRGVYGQDGRIEDYLESQGARPFMEAADRYLTLFWHLYDLLQKKASEPEGRMAIVNVFSGSSFGGRSRIRRNRNIEVISRSEATRNDMLTYNILKDVDHAVEEYCRTMNIPLPINTEEKMSIHIRAIEAWATRAEGGKDEKAG